MKVSPAKQAPQGYLVVQISTWVQKFYSKYAWKVFTAKVLPSETYPLYGIANLYQIRVHVQKVWQSSVIIFPHYSKNLLASMLSETHTHNQFYKFQIIESHNQNVRVPVYICCSSHEYRFNLSYPSNVDFLEDLFVNNKRDLKTLQPIPKNIFQYSCECFA